MKDGGILLCLILLASCGQGPLKDLFHKEGNPPQTNTTDPAFHEYIDQLPTGSRTSIIFGARAVGVAATCTKWSSGYKEIKVDRTYWNKISDLHRLELLAHEVGHCDYNLPHNNSLLASGCPVSIMYDTNFGGDCFDDNFDYYMEVIGG